MATQNTRKFLLTLLAGLVVGCQSQTIAVKEDGLGGSRHKEDADKFLIVDCLLPGQIRKLGTSMTYLSPRRPIRTSASDCEIRGGEYAAYDRADYRTALKVWLDSAKEGNAEAQVNVGEIYEKGLGLAPDYTIAAAWYKKAADQGNTRGAINLGYLYEKGLGVEENLVEALNWYRKASGLEDDDLAFASSIEAQTSRMSQELSQSLEETRALQVELEKTREQLQRDQSALNTSERELENLRRQLDGSKQRQSNQTPPASAELVREINERETQVQQQRQRLGRLQAELATNQQKLSGLKADSVIATIAGPTIELLDPPITLTRGVPSVRLRAAAKERIIIGKVKAPSGLARLTVNDREETPDNVGVFQSAIPLRSQQTPVKVVATDRQGVQASVNFRLLPNLAETQSGSSRPSNVTPLTEGGPIPIDFGKYYALIIGNNNYANFPELKTAANDARTAETLLREQYGFKTKLLIDADRYSILFALNELRETLTEKDNLLIYFAGHGELDRAKNLGYWLPVDSDAENPANWISSVEITAILNSVAARHVLVVADSCYSGALSRSSLARLETDLPPSMRMKWFGVMAKTRSRTVLTAGGLQPVLDTGRGDHSIFATAFFEALSKNQSILEGYSIYREVSNKVAKAAAESNIEQIPEYAPIHHAGHEAGEFLFVPLSLQSQREEKILSRTLLAHQ
ncbi:MAG: caspase family protein [Candidatus Thiodiazotropha sp.]